MIFKFYLSDLFALVLLLTPIISHSQIEAINLKNPSFEETPRKGGLYNNSLMAQKNRITGWYDCGIISFLSNTAPDIHSNETNFWNVNHPPSDGNTYMSLVVREDESWEGVSQRLESPLVEGQCYSLTIDLSKSIDYESKIVRDKKTTYLFDKSVVLMILGGPGYCNESEVLYVSPPVDNEAWKSYEIHIQPKSEIKYIKLQAYYIDDSEVYNGNVLVDNISPIAIIDCKE